MDIQDHKDRKMNQRFHKASEAPLLSSQLSILYDLEEGNLSYYTNTRTIDVQSLDSILILGLDLKVWRLTWRHSCVDSRLWKYIIATLVCIFLSKCVFKYVCTCDAYTPLLGLAHVSGIKVVAGYCCCSFFILCLWVCVPVYENELFIKALPQMLTAMHACVSVLQS